MSRAVPSLLHQGLVEFPAGTGMDSSPAIFTVILQTRHVSTEERGELPAAAGALTLVTQLIVQDIWLNFHLQPQNKTIYHSSVQILNSAPVFQQGSRQLCSRECYTQDFPPHDTWLWLLNTQNSRHFNTPTSSLMLKKPPRNQC